MSDFPNLWEGKGCLLSLQGKCAKMALAQAAKAGKGLIYYFKYLWEEEASILGSFS